MQTQKCEHASFKETQSTFHLLYGFSGENPKVEVSKIRNSFDKRIEFSITAEII